MIGPTVAPGVVLNLNMLRENIVFKLCLHYEPHDAARCGAMQRCAIFSLHTASVILHKMLEFHGY